MIALKLIKILRFFSAVNIIVILILEGNIFTAFYRLRCNRSRANLLETFKFFFILYLSHARHVFLIFVVKYSTRSNNKELVTELMENAFPRVSYAARRYQLVITYR